MKVLRRGNVDILESNLKESVGEYDGSKSYAVGDEVLFERYIYKALKENSGIAPENADDSAKMWQKDRVSNEWACFDYYLNTISSRENEIKLTFSCKGRGLYLSNVKGKALKIELLDAASGEVMQSQSYTLNTKGIASWSEYFFGSWQTDSRAHSFYFESEHLTNLSVFRLTLTNPKGACEIGSIICGQLKELATTLYNKNSISMLDYSKVTTDEDGNTALIKGNFKRTNAFEIIVKDSEMDYISYELSQLRGEACVFIISDYFECLTNFAFLKNHEILLEKQGYSVVSIEIEGLV